ncbi:MAG: cyclodeaminase/cyclohydrolase family protein, partial [Phycisphaerae bacterium]|nr:cyclodeaminase/cyclohydrolase family protein [Phycisphaerae bacterium]
MSAGKDYLSLPLRTFWADLASRSPTPGGGSVAASVGATAASLGCMVVEYTIGKPRFAEHESRLQSILAELKAAAETFGRLMAADMEAYGAVVAARKLDAVAQAQANAKALAVPMEIVALAAQVAALLDELGPITNPQLNGDLRISLILAVATADSAATLVRDNLPNLSNEA